jgi:hypothetical protein
MSSDAGVIVDDSPVRPGGWMRVGFWEADVRCCFAV